MMRMVPILIGVVVIGFQYVRGCQQGPFGRQQVLAVKGEQEQLPNLE